MFSSLEIALYILAALTVLWIFADAHVMEAEEDQEE